MVAAGGGGRLYKVGMKTFIQGEACQEFKRRKRYAQLLVVMMERRYCGYRKWRSLLLRGNGKLRSEIAF